VEYLDGESYQADEANAVWMVQLFAPHEQLKLQTKKVTSQYNTTRQMLTASWGRA